DHARGVVRVAGPVGDATARGGGSEIALPYLAAAGGVECDQRAVGGRVIDESAGDDRCYFRGGDDGDASWLRWGRDAVLPGELQASGILCVDLREWREALAEVVMAVGG